MAQVKDTEVQPPLKQEPALEEFLSLEQMARELGVDPRTLTRLHTARVGPPRVYLGKRVLYYRPHVLRWLAGQTERYVSANRYTPIPSRPMKKKGANTEKPERKVSSR